MDLNTIDVIIIIALIYSIYTGLSKGFILTVSSLIALVFGTMGSIYFSEHIGTILAEKTTMDVQYISITAFGITFITIIFGVRMAARILNQIITIAALGPINKLFGAIFNTLKMILILSVSTYIFDFGNAYFGIISQKTLHASFAYMHLLTLATELLSYLTENQWSLPESMHTTVEAFKEWTFAL